MASEMIAELSLRLEATSSLVLLFDAIVPLLISRFARDCWRVFANSGRNLRPAHAMALAHSRWPAGVHYSPNEFCFQSQICREHRGRLFGPLSTSFSS